MAYYRQPEYYRSFQCIAGDCPITCCSKWRIDWSPAELDKLRSADCSPKFRDLIENSFSYDDSKNEYVIKLSANRECPFLTEDKFCGIQRELGEEYISYICRNYPRTNLLHNGVVHRTCSASCYQVMNILCTDPNAMNLHNVRFEEKIVTIRSSRFSDERIKEHPELKFFNEIADFFFDIVSNKIRSVETSLVLGALAAQKLTEYINLGKWQQIPEIIKKLRPQLNATSVPSFENAAPHYGFSLGLCTEILNNFCHTNVLNCLMVDDKLSAEKFVQGSEMFSAILSEQPYVLRNIALNFMLEGSIPYINAQQSLFDNYCYYVATVACTKLICSAVAYSHQNLGVALPTALSYYVRSMYHSGTSKIDSIIELLHQHQITTPAKLALMLK